MVARRRAVLADPAHGVAIRDDLRSGLWTLPIWMQEFVRELLAEATPDARPEATLAADAYRDARR